MFTRLWWGISEEAQAGVMAFMRIPTSWDFPIYEGDVQGQSP